MPHKRNPIVSEQISGLARVVRGNAQVAFENIVLWHERDISHSSAERVILPDLDHPGGLSAVEDRNADRETARCIRIG